MGPDVVTREHFPEHVGQMSDPHGYAPAVTRIHAEPVKPDSGK